MNLFGVYEFAASAINGVHEKFYPLVQDISGVVGSIVSIATLLYLGSKIWSSYAKNEPIDIYPLLRPFVIAFLCAHFSTMVCKPIDALIEPISSFLYEKKTSEFTSGFSQDSMDKLKMEASTNETKDNGADEGFKLKTFFANLWTSLVNKLFELIAMIIDIIVSLLQFLLSFILMCSRVFFLSVLCMMGPIAFAISLFPGYQQTLNQWIAKYVSISFWLPCIYMCDIFINVLGKNMLDMVNAAVASGIGAGGTAAMITAAAQTGVAAGPVLTFTGLVILLISLLLGALSYFLYTTVPTISSWIITGGDVHGIQGMLGTTTILSAVTAIAGAKTGKSLAAKNSGASGSSGTSKGGAPMLGSSGGGIGSAISGLFGKK